MNRWHNAKMILSQRWYLLMALAVMMSCDKTEEVSIDLSVEVLFPDNYAELQASGVKVLLVNQQTGYALEQVTGQDGRVVFQDPPLGIYDISISETLSPERAAQLIGIPEEVMLSAQMSTLYVHEEGETHFQIRLTASRSGDLVFKEIFYTGSRTPNDGTYYADQFIEIFNNSTEVIYLDGLLISDIMGNPTGTSPSPWRNDHDNVYAQTVWRIPGGGEDHPLEPGESLVISQNGLDHREENANSINLSHPVSDFEFYVEREDGRDFDNPDVPNMILDHFAFMGTDYVIHVRGPAMIIWRTDDLGALERVTRPGSAGTAQYIKIPVDMVIDGVEAIGDADHVQNKRMPPSVDAGYVFCSGSYVNESIRRKIRNEVDGRVVLQDTNNSSNDFSIVSPPTPKSFD